MKDPYQMEFTELKQWLSDRLQMKAAAIADLDTRRDEAPYERPLKLWKSGNDQFRNNFYRATLDLVEEAGTRPWAPEYFNELVSMLEAANLWETVGPLEGITQSRRLLRSDSGPQLQMLALRTLLALGWKGSPDFWLAQKELVGTRWPGLIFEGLAQQDVALAFQNLPELAINRENMRDVLKHFSGLMRNPKLSIETLREGCVGVFHSLRQDAAEGISEWFRLRNYPLSPAIETVHITLLAAIQVVLEGDSAPRFRSPMLRGANYALV